MDNKTINCPMKLIEELESLKTQEFLLRGHSSSTYFLQPQAFREQDIKKIANQFPISNELTRHWKQGEVLNKIKPWSSGVLPNPIITDRILSYVLYLLQYNYYLTRYYQGLNPIYSSNLDQEIATRLPSKNLATEQAFIELAEYFYLKILTRISLGGTIVAKAIPPQEITGYDETWPQHYSFPSAALDWTLSIPVALHFAIRSFEAPPSSGTSQLSICCFKQIDAKNSPVQVIEKSELKTNPRALRQEGLFTYFSEPCSFYIEHGTFPKIESYSLDQRHFIVLKRNIEINKQNIEVLRNYTRLHKINDNFLLLEDHYDLSKPKCTYIPA
ncbi:FRG domain-containing protein [Legionella fallonii]|uniref:FRG domain-containing protein n=1 Tax=Legionella fallonii LLAP-10 TaxID=1212491 RepID=A0A098G4N9_9GAMM|nr:FRG domain-containing protein [Legionella fallonii]CEG56959.1 protein of unknown function [FRG domain] [Legionella fallonii LLAP-10]